MCSTCKGCCCIYIRESIDSLCRDGPDAQYILKQKPYNFTPNVLKTYLSTQASSLSAFVIKINCLPALGADKTPDEKLKSMDWGLMFASQQPCDCAFLRSIGEKWVWFTASLKAEGLSINFSQGATSSDVSPQITLIHNLWCLVVWFNILVNRMLPNRTIGWPTKSECISNSDKEWTVCISASFLICWTYLLDKEFESSHQIFFIGGLDGLT